MTDVHPEIEQGETEVEEALEDAFSRLVSEGDERLHRPLVDQVVTGLIAGFEIGAGVLALLVVYEATGSHLLAGLAFSVGFLALLLGRSELFTESFLVPVTAVAAKHGRVRDLLRLWGVTLLANLAGGWVVMALVMTAFPELHATATESARHFVEPGWTLRTLALSVLAGAFITLMTRMQQGTDEMVGKMAAAVAGAFLLAGMQLFHSILDSLIVFGALQTGEAPFGYDDWLCFLALTVVGNALGGLGLVTLLRLVRSRSLLARERSHSDQ
ncbi:MAG: formate/nitrite transporter family protein [Frankiales bacterium]|nr:formate/nitrite transporter family protein [Frankiales bacterium]